MAKTKRMFKIVRRVERPADNVLDKTPEEVEKSIKEMSFVLKKPEVKVLPIKQAKKKSKKRHLESLGKHIPMDEWVPVVEAIAEVDELDLERAEDANRVDIIGSDWRVVVMACYGGEFTVNLFYDYATGFNTRKINVEYITLNELSLAINWLLESREKFTTNKKENK